MLPYVYASCWTIEKIIAPAIVDAICFELRYGFSEIFSKFNNLFHPHSLSGKGYFNFLI
jgi:hypothetical protein